MKSGNNPSLEILRPFAKMVAEEIVKIKSEKAGKDIDKSCGSSGMDVTTHSYRGLAGIQKIFHCGRSKASALKASGILDDALVYISPKIFLVDAAKALQAVESRRKRGAYGRHS